MRIRTHLHIVPTTHPFIWTYALLSIAFRYLRHVVIVSTKYSCLSIIVSDNNVRSNLILKLNSLIPDSHSKKKKFYHLRPSVRAGYSKCHILVTLYPSNQFNLNVLALNIPLNL